MNEIYHRIYQLHCFGCLNKKESQKHHTCLDPSYAHIFDDLVKEELAEQAKLLEITREQKKIEEHFKNKKEKFYARVYDKIVEEHLTEQAELQQTSRERLQQLYSDKIKQNGAGNVKKDVFKENEKCRDSDW